MQYIREGNLVYQHQTVGSAVIVTLFDYYYHAVVSYADSAIHITIQDYSDQVASEYSGDIAVNINGVDQTINIVGGIGTFAIEASSLQVTTNQPDIRNGNLTIGETSGIPPVEPGPTEEEVIAGLTLEVAQLNVRLTENERTIADLLLALASGGV